MSNQFVAEIRIFAGNFAPTGWALCNGQLMPISQNTALFSLLGTFYGGDGKSTFALPNLQGSAPLQQGEGPGLTLRFQGDTGGAQAVTLIQSEMPAHSHGVQGVNSSGNANTPANNAWASAHGGKTPFKIYSPSGQQPGSNVTMSPLSISASGGSLPHNNMPPYLGLNFIIALQGIFPPRT
jgi:microcystin-dependent protein